MTNPSDELGELEAALAAAEANIPQAQTDAAEINKEIARIRQQMQEELNKLAIKRNETAQALFEAQRKANTIRGELEAARRRIEREKEEAARKAREAELAAKQAEAEKAMLAKFDDLMHGFEWATNAMDHQVHGAKKIVRDKNVILADVMGLGKTFTSIIVAELTERATKEASPDFPFLGEEVSEYIPDSYQDSSGNFYNTRGAIGRRIAALTDEERLAQGFVFVPAHNQIKIVNAITRPVGRKVLYFCPSPLLRNVLEEWKMWAPHRNALYIGTMSKAERKFALQSLKSMNVQDYVVICNFEAWRRDKALLEDLTDMQFDTVIIDEAHNIKDMKSIAYRGIEQIIEYTNPRPEYIIPMTGTPVLNRPQELFTLLHLVNPQEFYNLNDFLYSYCVQDEEQHWHFAPGGLDRLVNRIGKHFLRRTKEDAGIKLPPQTVIHHELDVDEELYPAQARARKEMREFATLIIDKAQGKVISAPVIIAMYTRLRQIETWPAGIMIKDKAGNILLQLDVNESQKVDYCIHKNENGEWDGLIPAAIEDERMVLFSQFKAPLHELRDRIERSGKKAVILDGDTPETVKSEIRKDFDLRYTPNRSESKWDIVLCNYRVGGTGLNLTAATQLIVLDEEWNPGKRDQAYQRIDRIGQVKPTTVHVVRDKQTVDDWLASIMERKEQLVTGFERAVDQASSADGFMQALKDGKI